jgi:hypothetical protein
MDNVRALAKEITRQIFVEGCSLGHAAAILEEALRSTQAPAPEPWARFTVRMPCGRCAEEWTTYYTNDRREACEVLTHGRLCGTCYEAQEEERR